MALDVKVLDKDNDEIDLKQNFDDDDDMGMQPLDDDTTSRATSEDGDYLTAIDGWNEDRRRSWRG